jgi:YVTN family beta-propeller protein
VNSDSGTVSVVNDSLNRVVESISLGPNPANIAYDPANDEMYVSVTGSIGQSGFVMNPAVVTINSASNRVDVTIGVWPFFFGN